MKRTAFNAVLVLIVICALLFGLLVAVSNVNHGKAIRELEDRVAHLENQTGNEMEGVTQEDLNELESRLTAMMNDPVFNAERLASIESDITMIWDKVGTTQQYIADLQEQIDYLRRWAENQGFNPGTLYDDPDVTTPDEWSEYNDEYDEYDEGDEMDW